MTDQLQFDNAQAQRYLTLVDEDADAFTLQTFDDTDQNRPLARILNGSLDEHWDKLVELNRLGAGVYVTVNETNLQGRKLENMRRIRCVYQDDDKGAAVNFPLDPHIVVQTSPGKYQRLWICDGPSIDDPGVTPEVLSTVFRSVQERMIADYGSDPGAKDLPRVLRVPGFYHQKGEPHLVRIINENPGLPYQW